MNISFSVDNWINAKISISESIGVLAIVDYVSIPIN